MKNVAHEIHPEVALNGLKTRHEVARDVARRFLHIPGGIALTDETQLEMIVATHEKYKITALLDLLCAKAFCTKADVKNILQTGTKTLTVGAILSYIR